MIQQTITSDYVETYNTPAMIANEDSEFYHNVSILDHSGKRIYFKSEIDLPPGLAIRIIVISKDKDDIGSDIRKKYWAVVHQCQEILDGYTFIYGIRANIVNHLN